MVLAWAMSIHKSQGQTIQRVRIDLGRVFEKGTELSSLGDRFLLMLIASIGQSYVALSRAASLDGLQVVRFDPTKVRSFDIRSLVSQVAYASHTIYQVMAHSEVVKWSKKMEEEEVALKTIDKETST